MVSGDQESASHSDDSGEPDRSTSFVRWLLLDGNRWTVVLFASALVFLTFVGCGVLGVIGVSEQSLIGSMVSPSITGVFTVVTITTSINQLILSRILGSPEDIHSRTESVREFRNSIQEMNPRVEVSPTQPAAFLREIGYVIEDRTERLERVFQRPSNKYTDEVEDLTSGVMEATHNTVESLDEDDLHLYRTLSPVLNDEYSTHLHTIRQLRQRRSDLDEAQLEVLDDLESALLGINHTRHYFKTLYLHEAIADVSLYLFLTGIPSLAVSYLLLLSYDGTPLFSGLSLLVAVSLAMVVVLLPMTILFSYILRIVTIAKRTTTFGTFTPVDEMP